MAFVREIGRNGVLNSGIWPRHRLSNRIESIYQKEYSNYLKRKKRDINDIPINNCALRACYGISKRIESKNISIESIKFHFNDITSLSVAEGPSTMPHISIATRPTLFGITQRLKLRTNAWEPGIVTSRPLSVFVFVNYAWDKLQWSIEMTLKYPLSYKNECLIVNI